MLNGNLASPSGLGCSKKNIGNPPSSLPDLKKLSLASTKGENIGDIESYWLEYLYIRHYCLSTFNNVQTDNISSVLDKYLKGSINKSDKDYIRNLMNKCESEMVLLSFNNLLGCYGFSVLLRSLIETHPTVTKFADY